jgi:hypothetical protein
LWYIGALPTLFPLSLLFFLFISLLTAAQYWCGTLQDKNNLVVKWFYSVHPLQHFNTYYERVKKSGSGADQETEMLEGEIQEAEPEGPDS